MVRYTLRNYYNETETGCNESKVIKFNNLWLFKKL